MPGFLLPVAEQQFRDNLDKPLDSGKVYFYEKGTSSPLATYSDADLTVEHSNPVILSPTGRATIYVPPGVPYKVVVKTKTDAEVYTEDGVMVPEISAPPAVVNLPPGMMVAYGGTAAPAGWLLCDGAAYSRTDPLYAALFAAIGTTYGAGNGSTTFNIPDTRGKFLLGKAASGTGSVLGSTGGAIDHVHTGPSHTHTIAAHTHTVPAHTHSVPRAGWTTVENTPPVAGVLQAGGSGTGSETAATQASADNLSGPSSAAVTSSQALTADAAGTGNTGSANPPFLVVNHIIKL